MKNIQNILFFFAFSLLLFGCQQTIFINQNGYEPRVSVESDIAVDSLPKIYLTETQNYYGYVDFKSPAKYIETAKVIIIHNGVEDELTPTIGKTDTLTVYSGGGKSDTIYTRQKYYLGHTPCQKGGKYELKITHEGKEITSELIVPNMAFSPIEVEQKVELISDFGGGTYEQQILEVRVKDPAGLGCYYRAKMSYAFMQYFQTYNPTTQQYDLDSILSSQKNISEIVSDEINDGGTIKLKFYPYISSYSPDDTGYVQVNIEVECLDNASGKYWESVFGQRYGNGDPFTEPTLLYSNIKNGIGFFGVRQIVEKRVFAYKKPGY